MTWFKVDDQFHTSRKVKSIPPRQRFAAVGLWTIAGSWCAQELTDGYVPDYMIREWGATPKVVAALVDSGLWRRVRDGFEFCSWSDYNPSKARVEAERAANKARVEEFRRRKAEERAAQKANAENCNALHEHYTPSRVTTPRPDPTRPDPIKNYGPPPAAALREQTREREQPQPSDEFADGTPIPPEPHADPSERASLIAVPDEIEIPTAIETAAQSRRRQLPASPSAQTAVRLHAPPGLPRTVEAALAVEVQRLAADPRVDRADIDAALAEWARRPGVGPRLLPHLVADAARARARPSRTNELTKAGQRAADTLAMGQELIAELRKQGS